MTAAMGERERKVDLSRSPFPRQLCYATHNNHFLLRAHNQQHFSFFFPFFPGFEVAIAPQFYRVSMYSCDKIILGGVSRPPPLPMFWAFFFGR